MDVREKLVELVNDVLMYLPWGEIQKDTAERIVDRMLDHDVTVQGSKVVEIGQFKLPIADAILILKEEHKQRADGYATHLSYGGNGDPAEEVYLDALEMAIAALEWQNRTLPQPPKGE